MKSFLRENPTIAFGLGLPLLLVVLFLIISGVPSLLVAPPQYDVLYATGSYNARNAVQISVVKDRVQVIDQGQVQNAQQLQLWRYNPKTGAVKEIAIILPYRQSAANDNQVSHRTVIELPELTDLTVDPSSIAPDGYEFSAGRDRYSRNIFGGMFYSSRYNNQAVLEKDGRRVRLPNAIHRYYYRNTQFVGWVIPQ